MYISSSSYYSTIDRNIIYIETPGTVYLVYNGYGSSYLTTTYWLLDYNDYYRTGTGTTTYYGYSTYSSLLSWQNAYGQDANSKNVLPAFIDPTINLELSDYSNVLCPSGGSVNYDINRVARSLLYHNRSIYRIYS
jgi:hypothetical protein